MKKLFSVIWIDVNTKDEPMYGCSGLFKTKESALEFLKEQYDYHFRNDTYIGNIDLDNDILRIEYESEYYDVLEYKIEETSIKGDL